MICLGGRHSLLFIILLKAKALCRQICSDTGSFSCLILNEMSIKDIFQIDRVVSFFSFPYSLILTQSHCILTYPNITESENQDFLLEECPIFLVPFAFRTVCQGTLPTNVPNSLKFALQKSKVAVLVTLSLDLTKN